MGIQGGTSTLDASLISSFAKMMAQGLRAPIALSEDLGPIARTHMAANNHPQIQSQGIRLPGTSDLCGNRALVWCTDMQVKLSYIKQNSLILRLKN